MKKVEHAFEALLFSSRWLAAPFYLGLLIAMVLLFVAFVRELVNVLPHFAATEVNESILIALSLIELTLSANLLVIVILAGYENFVSKIEVKDTTDRPSWMGHVSFSGIKLKVFSSIVAISGVQLLRGFMRIGSDNPMDSESMLWLLVIHLAFVLTTVLSALTDWLSTRAKDSAA